MSAAVFRPGQPWLDTSGAPINAHGGGILFHAGRYYWHGQHMVDGPEGNRAQVGVHCYSSADLLHWRDEGIALAVDDDPDSELARGCVLERPKVLRSRTTGRFVMWFHLEWRNAVHDYSTARSAIAVAEHPAGPFRFLRSMRPHAGRWPANVEPAQRDPASIAATRVAAGPPHNGENAVTPTLNVLGRDLEEGQQARDMTVFVDDDGVAYHVHASEHNSTLHLGELAPDLEAHTGRYVRAFPARWMEAPALFRANGHCFLLASGCTGWAPNAARSARAPHPLGPWTELGNPCAGVNPYNGLGSELTWGMQSTFIFQPVDRPGFFIAMFDLWTPDHPDQALHAWLPIDVAGDRYTIPWRDEWKLPPL
ncbi:MAG TPA: glycoside hydrolase family 43 protein [Kiritimatiellia bacterium]|nr:glycoside hydrolase family 43 protein [Kiritimatiellia bacterium]